MTPELVALVLAAGAGTRLRPLTTVRPKALCPVNNVPLVDAAIDTVRAHTPQVAVNVHHGREQMLEHLEGRVHISVEDPRPLGSAGAIGALRGWIDGRAVLVVNADRWHPDDLTTLVDGWDGTTARLMGVLDERAGADFDGLRFAGASLLPADEARRIPPERCGLRETVWDRLQAEGRLELIRSHIAFYDCGTPADYHRANMAASGGRNVVGEGAVVEGEIERCVLWPGVHVREDEWLRDAIRASATVTVAV